MKVWFRRGLYIFVFYPSSCVDSNPICYTIYPIRGSDPCVFNEHIDFNVPITYVMGGLPNMDIIKLHDGLKLQLIVYLDSCHSFYM